MVFFEDVVPFNLEAVFNLIYDIFKINDLYNQTLKNTYAKCSSSLCVDSER